MGTPKRGGRGGRGGDGGKSPGRGGRGRGGGRPQVQNCKLVQSIIQFCKTYCMNKIDVVSVGLFMYLKLLLDLSTYWPLSNVIELKNCNKLIPLGFDMWFNISQFNRTSIKL